MSGGTEFPQKVQHAYISPNPRLVSFGPPRPEGLACRAIVASARVVSVKMLSSKIGFWLGCFVKVNNHWGAEGALGDDDYAAGIGMQP